MPARAIPRTKPTLFAFDRAACQHAHWRIAGVDEVGRGPLAGPVVAAAVILRPDAHLPGLADSKALTALQRETLYPLICRQALALAIGWVDPGTIDRINILQASLTAMARALARLPFAPDLALIDGNQRIPAWHGPQQTVIKGDSQSAAIAAAAIVAKVQRDRYMATLHGRFPAYGFESHKGYYVAEQIEALRTHGPCPHHRASFHIKAFDAPSLPGLDDVWS